MGLCQRGFLNPEADPGMHACLIVPGNLSSQLLRASTSAANGTIAQKTATINLQFTSQTSAAAGFVTSDFWLNQSCSIQFLPVSCRTPQLAQSSVADSVMGCSSRKLRCDGQQGRGLVGSQLGIATAILGR